MLHALETPAMIKPKPSNGKPPLSLRRNNRNKSIYPLKRIFMHNLVGIYNKCTTEVLGVRCNGKAGSFFFPPIYKFMTSPKATSLIIYTHTIRQTHKRTYTRIAKLLHCAVWTSGYGPVMLKDAVASTPVCVRMRVHVCISLCVYVCIRVLVKTPSHVSQVMALLKHVSRTQQCFLHNCGVRMGRLTKRI